MSGRRTLTLEMGGGGMGGIAFTIDGKQLKLVTDDAGTAFKVFLYF